MSANFSQEEIVDFDNYFESDLHNTNNSDDVIVVEENMEKKPKRSKVAKPKTDSDSFDLLSTSAALTANSRKKLEHYLRKSPQYKVIDKQIQLLMEEYKNYKASGEKELMEKTQLLINDLSDKKRKFVKLFKESGQKTLEKDKNQVKINIENSEDVLKYKTELKDLEKELKNLNPNTLDYKLREYRKTLKMLGFPEFENYVDDFEDFDDETVIDFDDFDNNADKNITKQEYINFCGHIADLIDTTPKDVMSMNPNQIKKLLQDAIPEERLNEIKTKIERTKIALNTEINRIKGYEDVTDLVHGIFNIKEDAEEQPKEMLAAANVSFVKAVAYNTCIKLNLLHYFDDAVAYGLLGLTKAINRWYKIQKMEDMPISFSGFANQDIVMSIKRGLYELTSGGRMNGSVVATMEHKRRKSIENYLKNNPELKELPSEMIENLLDGVVEDKLEPTITESAYTSMVGGEDIDNADIWANAAKVEEEKMVIGKMDLINSIKALFGLFHDYDPNAKGMKKSFKQPLFDKYDYKLFKLLFGIEYKRESMGEGKLVKNTRYTQEEIAQILVKYERLHGKNTASLSQSAISTRIESLKRRLSECVVKYPIIKSGLQFLIINMNSQMLDSTFDEFEREYTKLEQKYGSFNVSDNLKLGDIYDNMESNPLDDEISNYFENHQQIFGEQI